MRYVLCAHDRKGIGKATASIAHKYGANLALADWNEEAAVALVKESGSDDRVILQKTDVSKWEDMLEAFQAAHKRFGVIHAVLSNAGVGREDFFKEDYDASGRLLEPDLQSVNINLVGQFYAVKCAMHYFAKWPETRCQIVMTGSAASFSDTPPNHLYCAAKAGILGFMRSMRTQLVKKNVTVNMIAPWMTKTPMLPKHILNIWGESPANETEGVARASSLPVVRPDVNGKSFFVAGHQIVDFEDTLHETQPLWMGQQLSADVDEGQRRLIP